ncbi:MAG: DUF3857 domain-containing protein, partial [Planctomycetes bacterium]|nr:DUF3857 domain-containing protein [Planctomycetota bacterium]
MSPVSHSLPGLALSWIAAALIAAAGLAPAAARESGSPLGLSERIAAAEALWLSGSHERAEEAYRDVLAAIRHQSAEDLPAWMPEADLALRRIAELMGRDASARRLQDLLAEWSRPGDGVDPLVAALAVYHAGWASLQAEGDVEKAREVWKPLGFLESWRVIGAFENERGGGFHTAYGPEKELDLDAAYDGKKRQVAWRRLPRRPVAGDVDLDALFLPRDECLAYALTFVRSGADRRAALRFGTGDGYKVWVNGRLAGAEDIHRLRSFDQTAVAVDLRAGWNSILFKVAESDGPWGFLARLSDLDGGPLEGVEEGEPDAEALAGLGESYPLEGAPADTGSGAEPGCSTGVETALRRRIAEQPGDARAQYLLGSLLLEKKAHDTAVHPDTEALRRAAEIDDRPAAVHFQLARSHQREGAVQADRDDNAWRVAMQAASDRGSALAALALAGHYLSAFDNRIRARRHLGVALAANPDLEDALLLRGDIEARERFPRARERALETALAASPDSPALLLRRAGELSADGDLEGAESLVWGVLRRNHTLAAARWRLGDILLRRGAAEEAVLWIREDAQLRPFDTGPLRRLATIHLGRDEPARAVEALEEALEICPEDHEIHELRGNALLEQLSRDEAIAAWERALELQPNLPDLRERLEFERAAEGGFEDEFRIDAAPRIAAALEETGEIDSDDPARVLLELTAIEVNRDGTTREFSQTVIQILNDRGVEMFNRFGVPYAGSEQVVEFKKARVTRPDGTVVDAKLSRHGGAGQSSGQGQASVDLPPLSPGDVFEVEFVREDIAQSFFGDYFGHREIFQGRLAIAEKVLRLRLPRERRFHFHQKNLDIEPVKEDDPDSAHVTYSWTVRDVARIDEEPGMPSPVEFAPQVEVSTFESWDAFATWYHNLIRKQFE